MGRETVPTESVTTEDSNITEGVVIKSMVRGIASCFGKLFNIFWAICWKLSDEAMSAKA